MAAGTILIVDDNAPLARSLAELLSRRRFRTVVADTAAAALRLAHSLRPDLVIADLQLPAHSGVDLAERLAAAAGRVPVILMSAAEAGWPPGRPARGVVATVAKPFDPLVLIGLVRRALRRAAAVEVEFPLVRSPRLLPARRAPARCTALTAVAAEHRAD